MAEGNKAQEKQCNTQETSNRPPRRVFMRDVDHKKIDREVGENFLKPMEAFRYCK